MRLYKDKFGSKGEKAKKAKLTNKQAEEIRRLRKEGVSVKELSQRYSLSQTSICDILRGVTYANYKVN